MEAKLEGEGHEPKDVQVVVGEKGGCLEVQVQDASGVFLRALEEEKEIFSTREEESSEEEEEKPNTLENLMVALEQAKKEQLCLTQQLKDRDQEVHQLSEELEAERQRRKDLWR